MMQTAKRGCSFISLDVSLNLDVFLPDPVSFVPVNLGAAHSTVWQPYGGDLLQFTPPAGTICFGEMLKISDVPSHGDDLNARDFGKDLEVAHSPRLALTTARMFYSWWRVRRANGSALSRADPHARS